jgi:hypothetical protein
MPLPKKTSTELTLSDWHAMKTTEQADKLRTMNMKDKKIMLLTLLCDEQFHETKIESVLLLTLKLYEW